MNCKKCGCKSPYDLCAKCFRAFVEKSNERDRVLGEIADKLNKTEAAYERLKRDYDRLVSVSIGA